MKNQLAKLWRWVGRLEACECGGAMVEFVLVLTLLGLGATAGAKNFARSVDNAYGAIATDFSTALAGGAAGGGGGQGGQGGRGGQGGQGGQGGKGGKGGGRGGRG